jgi:hypothetical protein
MPIGRGGCLMPPGHLANLSSAPRERLRTPAIARTTGERLVDHSGCCLLIYAPQCQFNLVDGDDFRNVIVAAADRVGRDRWGAIFEGLYVLDSPSGVFVGLRNDDLNTGT